MDAPDPRFPSPGPLLTAISEAGTAGPRERSDNAVARPGAIARAALFPAGPACSSFTGAAVRVDGGPVIGQ